MAGTGDKLGTLRPGRFEGERVLLALAISILVHALIWGFYELNRDYHWTARLPFSAKRLQVHQMQRYVDPIEFVTVETPSTQAPATPKYISNRNSVAADNSQNKSAENPQLNGRQTDVPKVEDELRARIAQAQAAAEMQQSSQSQGKADSKPAPTQGDMTLGKPEDTPKPQDQPPRPRTLRQAYQEMAARFPGMTMKEDGGAQKKARVPSFDVKVTGFGDYDERFIETVCHNWWNLLDSRQFPEDRTGKVVLLFRLNYDGSISQVRFAENTVGDLLGYVCEKAVLDGAPYERWSDDMRLKLGEYTDVEFTFDYYSN